MAVFTLHGALQQKLLPAVTFSAAEDALPLAEAFLAAGLFVLEIPFRTAVAAEAVTLIRKAFPEIVVGAGTLLTTGQLQQAINAGAQFGLSPGFNPTITSAAKSLSFPFIPGVMTPSEIEMAYASGFQVQKLFPAEQLGGIAFLKAMQGPYEPLGIQFIPMGGVNVANANLYASQKNVIALGGSWLATPELLAGKQFKQIQENVRIALDLVK
jgi:2-dehydro-3-deoxyphosphogluconate aldolase / (4S)-4-hydroxy-2-oxoglutarate aldolase